MSKIYKLLHYKNPAVKGYDYATVSEREYPKPDLFKFYSEANLPQKYRRLMLKPYNEDVNEIETWYIN